MFSNDRWLENYNDTLLYARGNIHRCHLFFFFVVVVVVVYFNTKIRAVYDQAAIFANNK